jgi:hypothetical protein
MCLPVSRARNKALSRKQSKVSDNASVTSECSTFFAIGPQLDGFIRRSYQIDYVSLISFPITYFCTVPVRMTSSFMGKMDQTASS